jgi:hypothetical protein
MEQQSTETLAGLSRKLAEFTVNLRLDQIPQTALDNARVASLGCFRVAGFSAS